MFFSAALLIAALPFTMAQSTTGQAPILSLQYPIARGNAGEVSKTAPCAGFRMDARLDYPMTGGDIAITAVKDAKSVQFAYSTVADPQSNDDFVNIGSQTNVPHIGTSCLGGLDFGAAGLTAGQNITIQMKWAAGPQQSVGYVCADVTLVETQADVTPFVNYTCTNTFLSTQTTKNGNPELTEIRAAAAESSLAASNKAMTDAIWASQPGAMSLPAAGGVGAGLTLAVVALVLVAGYFTGAVGFGKRQVAIMKQSHSDTLRETKSISSSV